MCLGGRGAGKTRAGAEWIRHIVEGPRPYASGRARRVALVGETFDQVREVMVAGPSGILESSPPDRRPIWLPGRRRLEWPNGAIAECHSAHDPDSLRGPQFDGAWVDELAKWKKGQEAWDMLQFALRLGELPQQVVTTTPQNVGVLRGILDAPSTVVTKAPTEANRANLASSFLAEVRARYENQRLARQELDGDLLDDVEGALWTHEMLERARNSTVGELKRIVVAVDPPVTSHTKSDECGIIVAGIRPDEVQPGRWKGVVLEDASVRGASPLDWAQAAIAAMERHGADRMIAEVNQGGDMIETIVRQIEPYVSFGRAYARSGKSARAEPVAALYEQGRVQHAGGFHELEDQMVQMTTHGYRGKGSPDRVDALVWALTDLLLGAKRHPAKPQIRSA